MQFIMKTLPLYEAQSDQFINKGKSLFSSSAKLHVIVKKVKDITRFMREIFPLTYPDCPVGHSNKKKVHYSELIKKI